MVEILYLQDSKKWKKYLSLLPIDQQDIYYTPEYYSLYENYGDGKAMCFVFKDEEKLALYPFLRNSIKSTDYKLNKDYFDIQGAYGYNGILTSDCTESFISEFYTNFLSFCKETNIIAEFTRFNPIIENKKFSEKYYAVIFNRKTVKISLSNYSSIDEIWSLSYTKEARKNCRKSINQGLSFTVAENYSDYEKFYNLYLKTMKAICAGEYYYFSSALLKELYNRLKKFHTLILVLFDNIIVGGFIIFHFGENAHNFLSAGSIENRFLKINDYMQDIAIRISIKKKCKTLHLGGGVTNKSIDSLLRFKSKFSNERCDFFIGKKIHNEEIYNEVVSLWSKKYPEKMEIFNNTLLKYHY